jgi:hypothetical protein
MRVTAAIIVITSALIALILFATISSADTLTSPCPPGMTCNDPTATSTLQARQYMPLVLRDQPIVPGCPDGYICVTATSHVPTATSTEIPPRATQTPSGEPAPTAVPCPPGATCGL